MSTADAAQNKVARNKKVRSPLVQRFLEQRLALFAAGFILFLVAVSALAPWLAPYDPYKQDLMRILESPSGAHWLGTDELGRDQFSRFLYAGRTTLLASAEAVAVCLLLGLPFGLLAGYLGGIVDTVLSRLTDALMSAPALILAVAVVAVLGPGLTNAMLAIGVVSSPSLFRIVRGATISVRSETYIEACRAIGCTPGRIMRKHVLLNIIPPVAVQVALLLGVAMLAEASLSFLGLGVRPPMPSWGSMLRTAFDNIYAAKHLVYAPGIAIGLAVLAFSTVGDGLREVLSAGRRS
ncbi:MAG TPA: ABC transporter permease [Nocardioides sp.]